MNLLLFNPDDRLDGDRIRVKDRRLEHLLTVHRAAIGDSLRVGEIGGRMGCGEILAIDGNGATLAVALDAVPPPKLPLVLVVALPRPKMLRRVVRAVAEFGVGELHLINSYRVEKSYWQTPALAPGTIRQYLLHGLEQSRDTMLPKVTCHRLFRPFVEDVLPGLVAGRRALLAHPGEHPPCPRGVCGETLLVVGPEGGLIPYEVTRLQEAGCEAVSLGPRILRVENALISLLGRLF